MKHVQVYRFISTENNTISHLNDNKEFHLPWKGITNDKHAIIPWSPALTNVRETWLSAVRTF